MDATSVAFARCFFDRLHPLPADHFVAFRRFEQFWASWLHEMSNSLRTIEATFREVLDLNASEEAGILPMQTRSVD